MDGLLKGYPFLYTFTDLNIQRMSQCFQYCNKQFVTKVCPSAICTNMDGLKRDHQRQHVLI